MNRPDNPIRTQKAVGVFSLAEARLPVPLFSLMQSVRDIERFYYNSSFTQQKRFARPCPPNPEHGFVESRIVRSKNEALGVFAEAIAENADSEMLLMQPIDAVCSGVLVPGMLTIGPGNDGVTGGKQGCFSFPIRPDISDLPVSEARIQNTPYLEFVTDTQATYAVQLRDGVKVSCKKHYIPCAMTVTKVVRPEGEHVAFSKMVKTASDGLVLYAPGTAMTNHYAVQIIKYNEDTGIKTAVITEGAEPQIGSHLVPPVDAPIVPDYSRHVLRGLAVPFREQCFEASGINGLDALNLVLFALHNTAYLSDSPDGMFVTGVALAWAAKLCVAACLGELRHSRRRRRNREHIYRSAFDRFNASLAKLHTAEKVFLTFAWPSGYGGVKWHDCATKTVDLVNGICNIVKKPNRQNVARAILALNECIHAAHNGGVFLTKFGSTEYFDRHNDGSVRSFLATMKPLWYALTCTVQQPWTRKRIIRHYGQEDGSDVKALLDKKLSTRNTIVTLVQATVFDVGGKIHVQYKTNKDETFAQYHKANFTLDNLPSYHIAAALLGGVEKTALSFSGSDTKYVSLLTKQKSVMFGGSSLWTVLQLLQATNQ